MSLQILKRLQFFVTVYFHNLLENDYEKQSLRIETSETKLIGAREC